MKTRTQKAALKAAGDLEKTLKKMMVSRKSNPNCPRHPMGEVEESFEHSLRKIDELTAQYSLDDTISFGFKKRMVDKIYARAIKRKEYEWAASFAKKYSI